MRRPGEPLTVRVYVDACHPVWGMNLVYRFSTKIADEAKQGRV
jgi:hypothetical protein